MSKGGARARSGPPPDPNALRRERDGADWVRLPAEGRKGRAPAWPLSDQTQRERTLWAREWRRPQAIVWERNGQQLEVAMFVRALADGEKPDASVSARTLVRQLMDSLGLTVPGMRANRWAIVADEVMEKRQAGGQRSTRDRFTVVTDAAGA